MALSQDLDVTQHLLAHLLQKPAACAAADAAAGAVRYLALPAAAVCLLFTEAELEHAS
jgi:hypothetical protein